MEKSIHTNRLSKETSPYLLQHAHNPVDWYPWGSEALDSAKKEDKPILLSVGYAACHWCHVMERESFENEEIARQMNEHFVCIKVDREERPDLDDLYMKCVQMTTGHGGWPMTVFLTPDGHPFYGGTYFPPEDRMGMPGFRTVLNKISEAFRNDRSRVETGAAEISLHLKEILRVKKDDPLLTRQVVDHAAGQLLSMTDSVYGGFGDAPKFPHPLELGLLLRFWRQSRDMAAIEHVRLSLDLMARGGIYDQIGGGFHRYSVDGKWVVPHFEKMLYDNALLARTYIEGYQALGDDFYRRIAEETLDYVLREMRAEEGGFHSSQDADSEGVEGKFYVWNPEEIQKALGVEDAGIACDYFGVTEHGNFEDSQTVLSVSLADDKFAAKHGIGPKEWAGRREEIRRRMLVCRDKRIKPGKDDKILASWNGLMISAFAHAGRILGVKTYLEAADRASNFLLREMVREGRLLRTYRNGKAKLNAYLEDYAFVVAALLDLYEATFEARWVEEAILLNSRMLDLFWDKEEVGFFFTSHDHESLIARAKTLEDGVIPSGNSVAVMNLLRLHELTLDESLKDKAIQTLRLFNGWMRKAPAAASFMIGGLDFYLEPPISVVLAARRDDGEIAPFVSALNSAYFPNKVVSLADPADPKTAELLPVLRGKKLSAGKPVAYVCRDSTCSAPILEPQDLASRLGGKAFRKDMEKKVEVR